MSNKLIDFEEAIQLAGDLKKHLLLGNGFSISLGKGNFSYSALYKEASKKFSGELLEVFKSLDTNDFEKSMRYLRNTSDILKIYDRANVSLLKKIELSLEEIKEGLIQAVKSTHPSKREDILDSEYTSCIGFFSNFENIYTLNYDLLLYWVIMNEYNKNKKSKKKFRYKDDFRGLSLIWKSNFSEQNIFYLHGAMHLFRKGINIIKIRYDESRGGLIEQIGDNLTNKLFPVFVAEGKSKEKQEKIQQDPYLNYSLESLSKLKGAVFIFGHSLDDNDDHILNKIVSNETISKLFISIYGDSESDINQKIINKAKRLSRRRGTSNPLVVNFYDAASAKVWR